MKNGVGKLDEKKKIIREGSGREQDREFSEQKNKEELVRRRAYGYTRRQQKQTVRET